MPNVHAPPCLPTELWLEIIRQLPPRDQKSCLSVSKVLHDIAQTFVFSKLVVQFGIWRNAKPNEDWTDEQKAAADHATRLSLELLKHIVRSPELARTVTKVTVRAYTPKGESYSDELMDALAETLKLVRLRAFVWEGCAPGPQNGPMRALCEASSTSLSELLLPPNIPEILSPWLPSIDQFQLQSLSFQSRHAYPFPDDYDVDRFAHMAQTVKANAKSLRYLCLDGSELVEALSFEPFSALVELDLVRIDPINIDRMRAVFQHCSQLRSLAMSLNDDHHTDGEVEGLLHGNRDALPQLTAFKFIGYYTSDEEIEALAKFLKRKTALERLDFVNPGGDTFWSDDCALNSEPLLKILRHLPRLAVLGCDIRTNKLTAKHFAKLSRWIPPSVTALSLTVAASKCVASEQSWIKFFEGRSACEYLHIILDPETKHGSLKVDLREVSARHLPAPLELLGYEDTLRWVSRDNATPAAEANMPSGLWPPARVHFRTVDDFGAREEWEWLLRYHNLPIRCHRCSGTEDSEEDDSEFHSEGPGGSPFWKTEEGLVLM